jgi:hypothetical protein
MTAPKLSILMPLALTTAVLLGAGIQAIRHPTVASADPYKERVRRMVARVPRSVRDASSGAWVGQDLPLDEDAEDMLKPNAVVNRRYVNTTTGEQVDFLLVHTSEASSLRNHWPPVCYKSSGWEQQGTPTHQSWGTGGLTIEGNEYAFIKDRTMNPAGIVVDDVLLLPDGTMALSMDPVSDAAEDLRWNFFGAAQIQLVFHDRNLSPERRRQIVATFLTAARPLIDAIRAGGKQP